MDLHRADWNRQQQVLKAALSHPDEHPEWLDLFLKQHAQVHASVMASTELWSFEDEVLSGLDDGAIRRIPANGEHSIAWISFHLARIEDVTMNVLLAGSAQVIESDGWLERMGVPISDTANAMSVEQVTQLSAKMNVSALRAYRIAVGQRTRQVVCQLAAG